jgi:hypothetical protein
VKALPPVAPAVLADILDALPPRLRKRVDATLNRATNWPITIKDNQATATVDDETTLTWTLTAGVLTTADALACSCLLAPRCLHRGIAAAAAEIAEPPADNPTPEPDAAALDTDASPAAPGAPAGTQPSGLPPNAPSGTQPTAVSPGTAASTQPFALLPRVPAGAHPSSPSTNLTKTEHAAAAALWAAGTTVLRAGASGSGTVVRAELLRAVHQARVAGLHRAAGSGLRVATALAAARANDAAFDRAGLTDDLLDLLLLCHDLRTATTDPGALRGTARREYHPVGSLRLYGLCTEAVVATTGYGGVVTHLVDDDGVLWTIPAIMPGGAERVPAAANGPVAVGESGLTHRALGRAGLVLSGGTASPDHRLGAGQKVRAVAAQGVPWHEQPAARLWQEPLTDQVARAFAAHNLPEADRPAGAALLFLDAEVLGPAGPALRVATDTAELDLTGDADRTRENLRVLATATGTRLRVIARLLPHLPATATALSVQGDALTLPTAMNGTVDLALDRLQRSHVPTGVPRDLPRRQSPEHRVPPPLHPLRNLVHRIALAGRSVATATSSDRNIQSLTTNGLTTTAAVLATLTATTHTRHRDAFGRTTNDHTDDFPRAWLTAALHLREFTTATAHHTWLST